MPTWFDRLTGFAEESHACVHYNIAHDNGVLVLRPAGRSIVCDRLETPSLNELRKRAARARRQCVSKVREVVAEARRLHLDTANAGALFQIASQFSLLEMASPSATPEMGVGIYEDDQTHGRECAIAAGAGTIYRNYFAEVNGRIGQTADNQCDCLAEVGATLGNANERLWRMRNGYVLATAFGLVGISKRIAASGEPELNELRGRLRIGIQWNTQVTAGKYRHLVSQACCSALPVAYSRVAPAHWERFARLILEALYEATLCAATLNAEANSSVYLTAVGEGVFGNSADWIYDALERAVDTRRESVLDVAIVNFRAPNPDIARLLTRG
ncbi:MAG: hypothetical protein FJW30_25095 [Acidobacteria bacterium]|nr:hypothetical protein [Acidobacteriota bacterium]